MLFPSFKQNGAFALSKDESYPWWQDKIARQNGAIE
jgi:hypothetical protein